MTEVAALGLKVDSDGVVKATDALKQLATAAGEAEKGADKLAGGSKKADDAVKQEGASARKAAGDNKTLGDEAKTTAGSMHRMAEAAGGVTGRLIRMATAALSAGAYIKLADSWSDMRSQLGAAIGDMDAANGMMKRMLDIANASYAPLDQTVQTYAQNVSVLRDLGKSASEAADFTESLNHMLVITATKGEQAASVQGALSKAMAVGRLQADGLETVLANGGRVAQALADELGTTTSGLRKFASEGKITGQVIADAVIRPLEDVRQVAGDMPATIGDAFGRIGTNITAFVGQMDQITGVSGTVAEGLIFVADNIDMVAGYAAAAATAIGATMLPAIWGMVTAGTAWAASLWGVSAAMAATGIGAFVVIAGTLVGKFFELVRATGSFSAALVAIGEVWQATYNWLAGGANALGDVFSGTTQRIGAYFTTLWASVQTGFATLMAAMQAGINKMIDSLNKISFDRPDWMGGGTFGIKIDRATFAEGYVQAAEASARTAQNMHDAADAAFAMSKTRLDGIEGPAAALKRILADSGEGVSDDGSPGLSGTFGSSNGGGKGKGSANKLAEEMARRWETLSEGFASEYELAMQHYARDQETLKWALDTKRISQEEYQDSLSMLHTNAWGSEWEKAELQYRMDIDALQAALDHKLIAHEEYYEKLRGLQWGSIEDLGRVRDTGITQDLSQMSNAFGDMQSMAGSNYDSLLKAQRVFGAASALISTYQGAAKALELPFPMNIAAAGKVIAAGMGMVNAIKSAKPVASISGGAGISIAAQPAAAAQTPTPQNVILEMKGSGRFSADEVEDMIKQIQKATRTGVTITTVRS